MNEPVQAPSVFDPAVKEITAMRGTAHIMLHAEDGTLKEERFVENIITAAGIAHMAQRISGLSAPAAMGWMAIGTTATAAGGQAVGDTTLGTEVARVALSPSVTVTTTTQANDTINYQASFSAGGPWAITEAGVFGVVTANTGPMLNHIIFAVINKASTDTLSIVWKVKVA